MKATRLVLERTDDNQFIAHEHSEERRIRNCQIIQYTKSPEIAGFDSVGPASRLEFTRTITPLVEEGRCEITLGYASTSTVPRTRKSSQSKHRRYSYD